MSEAEADNKADQRSGAVSRRRPMYYGGDARPMYYGGSARPMYYGGGGSYGGAYDAMYGGSGGGAGQEEESVVGSITLMRLVRVCLQRWVTIAVFVIIGLIAAFAFYRMSPTVYEAVSVFEMMMLQTSVMKVQGISDGDRSGSVEEVVNTRLAMLRSRQFFLSVIAKYRELHPSAKWDTEDLVEVLKKSQQTLVKRSRLIQVSARSTDSQLAADLANVYVEAADELMAKQNLDNAKSASALLSNQLEAAVRARDVVDQGLLAFRREHLVDLMRGQAVIANESAKKTNLEILSLQGKVTEAELMCAILQAINVNDHPENFLGKLPETAPRYREIADAFKDMLKTEAEKNALLIRYTKEHPDVQIKEKELEMFTAQFADAVSRALETSIAIRDLMKQEMQLLQPRYENMMKEISELELKIATAESQVNQMIRSLEEHDKACRDLQQRIREVGYIMDENSAMIKPVEPALPPQNPVLPQPLIIFSAGPFLAILLGILFVLILDHLEDKVVGIADIEQRIRLKPLAILPHVRRKKREQIARMVAEDKFSQFAEAIATLRNLLDSPRYAEMSKVLLSVSTQPGEGKTITSCSLAISYALSGQKTLLIDFDMRRPRIARIFSKASTDFTSLPHTLAKADPALFPSLPTKSDVPNLDLVCSKSSSEISPSSLMGSGAIVEFFKWARENYDRVIVDSPPFGVVGDVMTLSSLVDSVMIMCCPNRTRFNPLKHAARHLTEAGAQVIGVVVNDVDFARHRLFDKENYHYKYAYQYGSKYGYAEGGKSAKRSLKPATAVGSAATRALADEEEAAGTLPTAAPEADVDVKDMFDASMVDDDE
ncbi:MAG: P-loop NTPase [Kiritimatiellaeota bacterium]|nr:P-loop NTPase [Kiritimatiellota bacterium]